MHVDVIDTYAEFERLRENWDSVYSMDPEAQFFLSWIWLSQLFLRRPESWIVLAARPNSGNPDYVAFFPLRPATRYSKSVREYINEMYMGGNFWADYTGLICVPDFDNTAIPALMSCLQTMPWAKTHFENIFASDRRIGILKNQFSRKDFRISHRKRTSKVDGIDNLISPFVRLPGSYEEYLQTRLSANTRQKIRRYQRKLESLDNLDIVESGPDTRDRDLDALTGYWKDRWADRKGSKVGTLSAKYREIIRQGLEADIVYMPVLRANNRPVAVLASFVDWEKKCLLFFVAGRDPTWKTIPAGLLLHAHSIRWAITNGLRSYDLLRGDEQYKYSLGAEDRMIACIRVETRDGKNLRRKLDPGSREFILNDMRLRIAQGDTRSRRQLCAQIANNWPNDKLLLRRCESHLLEAGDEGALRLIRAQLQKTEVPESSGDDRAPPSLK